MKILYGDKDISKYLLSYEKTAAFVKDMLIGNTVCAKIILELDNYEKVIKGTPDASINIYDDSVKTGTFSVYEEPENNDNRLKLTLYDAMINLNRPYHTKMTYPCLVRDQIVEIAKLANVEIVYSNLPETLLDKEINWYDNTINMRAYIGWIAEASGMNAYVDEAGIIRFSKLSTITNNHIAQDDIETYTLCNEINIQGVSYNNGLVIFERGESDKDTIYLSSDNPYIDDQAMVDYIYDLYYGLKFTSVKDIRMIESPSVRTGELISYNSYVWMISAIKTIYHGGIYSVQEIKGEYSSKKYQAVSRQIGDSTKIRMLTIEVNRNNNEVKILAKEQDDLNNKYAELVIKTNSIHQEVAESTESVYKMETGKGNIFDNCNQYVRKDETEKEIKYIADMPLAIDMQSLRNKNICMSVDVKSINAVPETINNRLGCKFAVTYIDNTEDNFELWFTIGVYYLAIIRGQKCVNIDKRIWRQYKIQDKQIKYVSNLGIYAEVDGEYVAVGRPKVEFGTFPTGFEFDMKDIRDHISTVEKNYTSIDQQVNVLTLQSVSTTEQVSMIKGDVTSLTTRIEKAEIQLTPQKILAKVENQLGYGIDQKFNATELKLTPTAIVNAVNERIGEGGKVSTSSTTLDKEGFHVVGRGIDVKNLAGVMVFTLDSNGNITMNNVSAKNGNFEGIITNKYGSSTALLSDGVLSFSSASYGYVTLANNSFQFSGTDKILDFTIINSSSQTEITTMFDNPLVFSCNTGAEKEEVMRIAKSVGVGILVRNGVYLATRNSPSTAGDVRAGVYGGILIESATDLTMSASGKSLTLNGTWLTSTASLYINGGLTVTGSNKHKAMPTSHGFVGMEALETPTPMFEDIGSGKIGENGQLCIFFDQCWMEVTSTDQEYFVLLQACGEGTVWLFERAVNYFVVKGTPGLGFIWCVKARQKGFEIERYKKVDIPQKEMAAMELHERCVAEKVENSKKQIYENWYDEILKERIGIV